jgi:pimeloyl-ACP methyl ester carboxylesterase
MKLLRALSILALLMTATAAVSADQDSAASREGRIHAVRRGYLDTDFGQLHFRAAGTGAQKLLLIHQIPNSSAMFEPVLRLLADRGFQAVAIDLAGYGASDKPSAEPSIEGYSSHVLTVFEHFGWEAAVVFGQHTGGSVAAQFAASYPQRVSALILGAPMVLTEQQLVERAARFREPLELPELRRDGGHILEMWRRRLGYPMPSFDLKRVNEAFTNSMCYWNSMYDGTNAAVRHDLSKLLPELRMPTLIVTGSEDQQKAFTPTIRDLRPDFRYVTIQGASSYVHAEKPQEWVDAVSRFVDEMSDRQAAAARGPRAAR